MLTEITKDMTIGDILDADRETVPSSSKWECIVSAARLPAGRPWKRPVRCTAWTRTNLSIKSTSSLKTNHEKTRGCDSKVSQPLISWVSV